MSRRYSQLFQDMYELKQQIYILNKKYEKYRAAVVREMDKTNVDKLEGENYIVKRSIVRMKRISKNCIPEDLWDRYSKSTNSTFIRISRK